MDANSVSCSDAGPGTQSQPYCSISAAIAAHNGPGITIVVMPGTYPEEITIPSSGTSSSPFVIEAPSLNTIVEGADSFSSSTDWSARTNAWLAAGVTWAPKQVFVDGARLDSVAASPDQLPPNSFVWVSGQGLYVNLGGDNPANHWTLVGHRATGFTLSGNSWVTISGFVIRHFELRGVNLASSCTNVTISNNTESFSGGIGIEAVGGSGLVIEDNLTSDNVGHGIALESGATGCTIHGNESFRNSDPVTRVSNGIYLFGSPSNTLSANRCHDNQDTGLHIQSGSDNCVAFNNVSYNNGDHGFDNLLSTGITHVCDVAYGNFRDGFSIEGSASGVHLSDCIAVNNGLTQNEFDLWVDQQSSVGFVSDYNIFWNSTTQPPFKFVATIYPTISGYQQASGQDAHSLQTDPMFLDGAGGNFHLMPGSPAIDSGSSSNPLWPATDAEGNSRKDIPGVPNTGSGPILYADRGAFERISTALDVPLATAHPEGLRLVPNPIRTSGTLSLALEQSGHLRVELLDAQGRIVRTMADRDAAAGTMQLSLSGADDEGRPLRSGVYFIRVETPGRMLEERCLILR